MASTSNLRIYYSHAIGLQLFTTTYDYTESTMKLINRLSLEYDIDVHFWSHELMNNLKVQCFS